MANHFDRALTLLTTAELLRAELNEEYLEDRPDRDEVGRLNSQLKHARETAGVHALLAQVEALYDLHAEVTELVKDLTGNVVAVYEPAEPTGFRLHPVPES